MSSGRRLKNYRRGRAPWPPVRLTGPQRRRLAKKLNRALREALEYRQATQ
jgi:hypothetical protein